MPHNDWLATSQWVLVVSCVFVVVQGQQECDGGSCAWAFGPRGRLRSDIAAQHGTTGHDPGHPAFTGLKAGFRGLSDIQTALDGARWGKISKKLRGTTLHSGFCSGLYLCR